MCTRTKIVNKIKFKVLMNIVNFESTANNELINLSEIKDKAMIIKKFQLPCHHLIDHRLIDLWHTGIDGVWNT